METSGEEVSLALSIGMEYIFKDSQSDRQTDTETDRQRQAQRQA